MTKRETNAKETAPSSVESSTQADDEKKKDPTSNKPRRRWGRRLLITVIVLFAFYTVFGFFVMPLLIRTTGIGKLNERLNGTASLQHATFNPFTWRLVLEGFAIVDESGARQIAFDRFDGDVQPLATLFQEGYHVHHARLENPFVQVERSADGSLNLASLFKSSDEPGEPIHEIPRVVVSELTVSGAEIVARDEAVGELVERSMSQINFTIALLDTREDHENVHRLTASLNDGGSIIWAGSFFADPLTATGTITVESVQLKPFMPYATAFTNGRIMDGRLSFEMSYDFAPLRHPRRASMTIDHATLEELLIAIEGDTIVTLPGLEIREAIFNADAHRVDVARIVLTDPHLVVRRASDGTMRLTGLLAENPTGDAGTVDASMASETVAPIDAPAGEFELDQLQAAIAQLARELTGPWDATLKEFVITGADVQFSDESREPAVEIHATDVTVRAGPLTLAEEDRIPFSVTAQLEGGGSVTCQGESTLTANHLTMTIDSKDLDLTLVAGYMPLSRIIPNASFDSGRLDMAGDVTIGRVGDLYSTTFRGTASISSLNVSSSETGRDVAVFDRLDMTIDSEAVSRIDGVQKLNWSGDIELRTAALQWPVAGGLFADADRLSAKLNLTVDLTEPEQALIRLTGVSTIGKAQVRLPDLNDIDSVIDEITLDGIAFDLQKRSLRFVSVSIAAPELHLKAAMLPPAEPIESAETNDTEESQTPQSIAERLAAYRHDGPLGYLLNIGQFTLSSGSIEIVDIAADPPVTITLEEIEVAASNIANDGATTAHIDIASRIQGTGQATILGTIDPFQSVSPFVDMTIDVSALPLKPYDPYAGHFMGYLIESGRATLNVHLHVEQGALTGSVKADLSRLHLGEKTHSSAAPDAPIKLGLDLIRDTDDHIRVDIDFDGDLNDPQFRLGRVIWDEMLGLLLRGATAPLRLLASNFAGDEEIDLSVLTFEPGSDQFTAQAIDKLDVLGLALTERPALRLAIAGRTGDADAEPLCRQQLNVRLLAHLQQTDGEVRNLTPARRTEAIEGLFAEVFPERVVTRVPVPPGQFHQGVPLAELEAVLLETIVVDEEMVRALIDRRAQRVIDMLVSEHAIATDRLRKTNELATPLAEQAGPRAELELY